MCIRQQSTPRAATRPAISGSARKALTSLTRLAPASNARSATARLLVSIEIRLSPTRPARPPLHGADRAPPPPPPPRQPLDHGQHARDLLDCRDRFRARPRRLPAE